MQTQKHNAKPKSSSNDVAKTAPLVSVIIPTYNCGQYIKEALESVFDQSYSSYEVIVVDDGSTDDTRQILEPYADRIQYVYQKNAGQAAARNLGQKLAKGEFVNFLDADDYFLQNKLKDQAALLESDPSIGVVHTGWRLVDQNGGTMTVIEPWHRIPCLDQETLVKWQPFNICAMMFRKSWLDRIGGFNPKLRQIEDVDLFFRLAVAGCKFAWLKKLTVAYRRHQRNISLDRIKSAKYTSIVLDHFFARTDLPYRLRQIERETRYFTTLWIAWRFYALGFNDETVEFLQKTLLYTPHPTKIKTLFSWAEAFSKWNARDGGKHERLQMSWQYFKRAISLDEIQWQSIERLLTWWTSMELYSRERQFGNLAIPWRYFQKAVQFEEKLGLPVEKMLEWWINVWWFYRREAYEQACQGLSVFHGLPSWKIVDFVKMTISVSPGLVKVTQITRLWDDLKKKGYIHPSKHHQIAALYLTVFGQAAMARQWRVALDGLKGALRTGVQPEALKAWYSFVRAALVYFFNPTRRTRTGL